MNKVQEQLKKFKEDHLKEIEKSNEEDVIEIEGKNSVITDFWLYVTEEYKFYAYLGLFLFYLSGQLLMNYAGFGVVYFLCFLMFLMFLSLGKRKRGEVSAYSVFNENFEALPGQMTSEQFEEAMLRRKKLN
uniref:SAYSvFN domain-containing protein n=1 Tax=Strongyloides venezuelensis TaxID=75913 RepID=A0A0K0FVI4_STRVS